MKIILKALREGLGRLIVFFDWIFSPRKLKRTDSSQLNVNEQSKSLKLYQFYACPFCIKTRRAIKRLNLLIESRNAQNGKYREDLLVNGGEVKVPCLRITEGDNNIWMYESSEIIKYLNNKFG
jgi:glutaredoxin